MKRRMVRESNAITTVCYGREQTWKSREGAIRYFKRCMDGCDVHSSEWDRYSSIVAQLEGGRDYATDEDDSVNVHEMRDRGDLVVIEDGDTFVPGGSSMKTSDLISLLQDSLEINGDLEVVGIAMGTIYPCIYVNAPDSDSPLYIELSK